MVAYRDILFVSLSINVCKLDEDNERDRPTDTVTLHMDVLSFQTET